jgi:2-polyprenyl-3-methyl-5-hydroxy-6-metoxy-1,4-benzoquinol methylase
MDPSPTQSSYTKQLTLPAGFSKNMESLAALNSSVAPVEVGDTAWPETGLESVKACPACGHAARELLHGGLRDRVFFCAPGEWNLYRCANCSAGYLDPRPTAATIALAYSRYFTHGSAGDVGAIPRSWWRRRRVAQRNAYLNAKYQYQLSPGGQRAPGWLSAKRRQRFDKFVCFLRYPGKGARVLDIGCGNGRVMMQLRSVGWEVSGVEPDPKSAAQARQAGLDVRAGLLESGAWPDSYFDAITMNHVIEHLHDPIGILRTCAQLLKPGGAISIATPNLRSRGHEIFGRDWLHLDTPRHLVLFTPDSLRKSLQITGFKPEPDLLLHPTAAETFRRSAHIQYGNDPMREERSLPIYVRLRTSWLGQKANRVARTNPHLAESVILIATRN